MYKPMNSCKYLLDIFSLFKAKMSFIPQNGFLSPLNYHINTLENSKIQQNGL
jgi:hypothetical protein